ncbi:hypothetical protein N7510_004081 [Penicillium lagena]|uniref:uncharacterized protein n=1 Tax=Penicillium lagena TaxID=94218 RepID=UPI002540E817|nr:uncharacterized protein N7510_004081 [Penicillium lagena]KAJ5620097.1 hypothetical protein N7510_004081 [Penicillium lagena]
MVDQDYMTVEPATLADISDLISLINEGLNPEGEENVYPHDVHGTKFATDVLNALVQADKKRVVVFVVRDPKGSVISTATVHKIDAGESFASAWTGTDWGIPLQQGVQPETLDAVFGAWARRHNKLMNPNPRVFLEALVTRKTWQKRGCASAILEKAGETADEYDYPLFLDAMIPEFYQKRGYIVLPDTSGTEAVGLPMVRKKKSERV